MIKRFLVFSFGVVCYLVFMLTVVYGIGFVGDMLVPRPLDGEPVSTPFIAVSVDLMLIALFGVQHSVMARQGFKNWLKRWIPDYIERSLYVLCSSLVFILLLWQWQPVAGNVWNFPSGPLHMIIQLLFWLGWGIALMSSFLINHFDLFGLRQVYLHLRGIGYTSPPFEQPALYEYVRHPLMLGFLIAFWATPRMSLGHLVFALGMSAYIFVGVAFEERDLLRTYGDAYEKYRQRVSMLIPFPRKK